jgi:transposase
MDKDVPLPVDPALLPRDPEVLAQLVMQLISELRKRDTRIQDLEHRMDLLLRRVYGRTSEKLDPAQLSLFDTLLEEAVEAHPDVSPLPPSPPSAPAASTTSHRAGHGRRQLPDRLKRVEQVHDLTPAEKEALGGEANIVLIGREETEQLEWEPSSLYVIRHVQLTYAKRKPLPTAEDGQTNVVNVLTASKPPQPIPGGLPGPGLLAHVATSKYVDHAPLHRQQQQFARHGLTLPRQTTCDWALSGADFLVPLYDVAKQDVLLSGILHTDATSVKIRDAYEKLKRTGYFWPYVGDDEHPLIVFDYTPTQAREGPAQFLQGYRGYLQADAHSVFDGLYGDGRIVEVGCWMHARRKFFEARTVDRLRAETALVYIGRLFAIDREISEQLAGPWRELPRAERHEKIVAARQPAKTTLAEFFAWLEAEAPKLVPKNPIRQAMDYSLRQQAALSRYCDDGRLAIDNGAAERALRGIALGRRNWLFCGSERGARAACIYFTLAGSCRRHEIDPFAYLRDLFTRLPRLFADTNGHPTADQLRPFLPDRWRP